MSYIESSVAGQVLEIRVNRPEKLNALSPEMYGDLALALGRLDRDPELRVGLVYAEGKHFSAGVELDKWAPLFAKGSFPVPEGGIDPFALSGPRCSKRTARLHARPRCASPRPCPRRRAPLRRARLRAGRCART